MEYVGFSTRELLDNTPQAALNCLDEVMFSVAIMEKHLDGSEKRTGNG